MGRMNDIHRSYENAYTAYQLTKTTIPRNFLAYDELGIYKILTDVKETAIYPDFVREVLGKLMEYDREHRTEYVKILKAYFENDCSTVCTAEALYCHKNTLTYKLNKIKEVLGYDILSNENRVRIMVAFLYSPAGDRGIFSTRTEKGKRKGEEEMSKETVCCCIEHHAVLFALMAKHGVELCGERGRESILKGMTIYGKERGRRMAWNARQRGDEINTLTNQAYGEWKPDYDGQMEFGQIGIQPALRTYISKCAWCDAWKKHGLTEYGKLYCVNVDNAVYQGYQDTYVCTQMTEPMSWGGQRCEFDWGCALTPVENEALAAKKRELGTSCMKDFYVPHGPHKGCHQPHAHSGSG